MHLETLQHLRSLADRHDDLVPIAKPLLLDLLDSYERHADKEHRLLTGLVESERELAQLREAGTPACPVFPLITGPCGGNWCVWASNKTDAYLWAFDPSQQRAIDGFVATLNTHVLQPPAAPDALNIVILQQLLKADDYDSMEAVKAAAQDYLHSLNACPLDFAHQPHDHCDGTPSSSRQPVNQVNKVTPVNPVTSPQPPNSAPETFEAHGHTWTRHTPGDPCPVPKDIEVMVMLRRELHQIPGCSEVRMAGEYAWCQIGDGRHSAEIIGWRYAEPQPSTPAK